MHLEYRVIANHLSASGLRLAPHLTHAPSVQAAGRGAGDMVSESSIAQASCHYGRHPFSQLFFLIKTLL